MTKAKMIRAYLKQDPDASPNTVSKMVGVSYGYAYKIVKEEQAKRATAEAITKHVEETTASSKPKRTTRKLRVCWKRLVKKFMRLTGLYTETK
jgi:hypothetical protein